MSWSHKDYPETNVVELFFGCKFSLLFTDSTRNPNQHEEEAPGVLLPVRQEGDQDPGEDRTVSFDHPPPYVEVRSICRKEYGRSRCSEARLIPQKVTK